MKGDFSRNIFSKKKNYSSVRLQQGRVILDSDWNEMVDIQSNQLRQFVKDVIGSYGGPEKKCGFELFKQKNSSNNFFRRYAFNRKIPIDSMEIGRGRYYINGIGIKNEEDVSLFDQPYFSLSKPTIIDDYSIIYLEVWERHINCLEDNQIREVGLQGPDTTTRAKPIWCVKVFPLQKMVDPRIIHKDWEKIVTKWYPGNRGNLTVATNNKTLTLDNYIGFENHFYRVEIHKGGVLTEKPSFKWSRQNGSSVLRVESIINNISKNEVEVTIAKTAYCMDEVTLPNAGQWVEVQEFKPDQHSAPGTLLLVKSYDGDKKIVLEGTYNSNNQISNTPSAIMRLWDHFTNSTSTIEKGAVLIKEGSTENDWIEVERNIKLRFAPGGNYQTGDYWHFAARPDNKMIEWENKNGVSIPLPPQGIDRCFAPLALVRVKRGNVVWWSDCRRLF